MRLQSLLGRSSSVAALMLAASLPLVGQAQETTSTDEEATLERVFVEGRRVSQTDEAIGLNEASNTVAVTREEPVTPISDINRRNVQAFAKRTAATNQGWKPGTPNAH